MDMIDQYIEDMVMERINYEKQAKKLFIEEGENVFALTKQNKSGCSNFEGIYNDKLIDAFGFISLEYAGYLSPIICSFNSEATCYVLYKDEVYEVNRFQSEYIRIIFIPKIEDSLKNKLLKFEDMLEYAKNMEI